MAVKLTLKPSLDELGRLRVLVDDFCAAQRLDRDHAHRIMLIVEELLSNTIEHGFGKAKPKGEVNVALARNDDAVEIHFDDEGMAFDPTAAQIGEISPLEHGGIGLRLVRALVADARYRRGDGRNLLDLVYRCR